MKESEIRPAEIFNKYLELAEKDVKTYFSGCRFNERNCPACGEKGGPEFSKKGFDYCLCPGCGTLFVNPLPEAEAFSRYYTESPSTRFWATDFYKHTEEARRKKIFVPRAKTVREIIEANNPLIRNIVDIGAGYGTFAEEISKEGKFNAHAIEPNRDLLSVLKKKGIPAIPKFLENVEPGELPEGPSCFTSFELAEHLTEPGAFFSNLHRIMKDGDLAVITTLNGQGLDILVLWEKSKSVHPPHHINFFNTTSLARLAENTGFRVVEVTTPGKLDIDILKNSREDVKDRFWKYFVENADEELSERMQSLVRESKLSSHMMIVLRK